jgi:lipid-binding SYLF domain-containing protein
MTGGSVGFQAGVSSTDVILVFRTQRGVDSIVNGKFTSAPMLPLPPARSGAPPAAPPMRR